MRQWQNEDGCCCDTSSSWGWWLLFFRSFQSFSLWSCQCCSGGSSSSDGGHVEDSLVILMNILERIILIFFGMIRAIQCDGYMSLIRMRWFPTDGTNRSGVWWCHIVMMILWRLTFLWQMFGPTISITSTTTNGHEGRHNERTKRIQMMMIMWLQIYPNSCYHHRRLWNNFFLKLFVSSQLKSHFFFCYNKCLYLLLTLSYLGNVLWLLLWLLLLLL